MAIRNKTAIDSAKHLSDLQQNTILSTTLHELRGMNRLILDNSDDITDAIDTMEYCIDNGFKNQLAKFNNNMHFHASDAGTFIDTEAKRIVWRSGKRSKLYDGRFEIHVNREPVEVHIGTTSGLYTNIGTIGDLCNSAEMDDNGKVCLYWHHRSNFDMKRKWLISDLQEELQMFYSNLREFLKNFFEAVDQLN